MPSKYTSWTLVREKGELIKMLVVHSCWGFCLYFGAWNSTETIIFLYKGQDRLFMSIRRTVSKNKSNKMSFRTSIKGVLDYKLLLLLQTTAKEWSVEPLLQHVGGLGKRECTVSGVCGLYTALLTCTCRQWSFHLASYGMKVAVSIWQSRAKSVPTFLCQITEALNTF